MHGGKKGASGDFGLVTAYVLTVGTVIGSGVFFKAPLILAVSGGDGTAGLLAWAIGAAVMLFCALAFAEIVSEAGEGTGASVWELSGYLMGRRFEGCAQTFFGRVYYPSLTAVLAWVSASYTADLLRAEVPDLGVFLLAAALLLLSFLADRFASRLADRFRTAATGVKLLPLLALGAVGIARGVGDGTLRENLSPVAGFSFLSALPAAAFAYEGWIAPASLGRSLKNPKRTLPLALFWGTVTVAVVYILYYLGLIGSLPADALIENGTSGAFRALFGSSSGGWLLAAVSISCLGTLSGLSMASARSGGTRGGCIAALAWLVWYYLAEVHPAHPLGRLSFDNSELPVITLYALYIPLFFAHMRKTKRRVLPTLGILSAAGMIAAAVVSHKAEVVPYLVLSGILLVF